MDGFSDRGSIPLASTNNTTSTNGLFMRFVEVFLLLFFGFDLVLTLDFRIAQQVCESFLQQLSSQSFITLHLMPIYSKSIHASGMTTNGFYKSFWKGLHDRYGSVPQLIW